MNPLAENRQDWQFPGIRGAIEVQYRALPVGVADYSQGPTVLIPARSPQDLTRARASVTAGT